MTESQLFADETIVELFSMEGVDRIKRKRELFDEAKKLGCKRDFENYIKEYEKDEKKSNSKILPLNAESGAIAAKKVDIEYDPKTFKPIRSIANYAKILEQDPYFANVYYNEQTDKLEVIEDTGIRWYSDTDKANAMRYIEAEYSGLNQEKYFDFAFQSVLELRKRNPIKEKIESIEWDGVDRIDNFLKEFLNPTEADELSAETSRLIFAGGINRLYAPGCKFDYEPIIIGGQGIGKSTFVRLLNPLEEYYQEVTSVDEKLGAESLQGGFVCEMPELSALKKTKDCEVMKAFITRASDNYRRPYEKHKTCMPRRTIIIGTTNLREFLNDATGGRRFLPVHPNITRNQFTSRCSEFKEYVMQCWAEALAKFKLGSPYMCDLFVSSTKLADMYAKEVDACTTIDNALESTIQDYIKDKQYFCVAEIFEFAFGYIITQKCNNKQLYFEIAQTIKNMENVMPTGNRMYFDLKDKFENGKWTTKKSRQRYYVNLDYGK